MLTAVSHSCTGVGKSAATVSRGGSGRWVPSTRHTRIRMVLPLLAGGQQVWSQATDDPKGQQR